MIDGSLYAPHSKAAFLPQKATNGFRAKGVCMQIVAYKAIILNGRFDNQGLPLEFGSTAHFVSFFCGISRNPHGPRI